MIQVAAPRLAIVSVVVDVPDVWHVVLLEVAVDALGEDDKSVLVATGEIEELQFLAYRGGIGH